MAAGALLPHGIVLRCRDQGVRRCRREVEAHTPLLAKEFRPAPRAANSLDATPGEGRKGRPKVQARVLGLRRVWPAPGVKRGAQVRQGAGLWGPREEKLGCGRVLLKGLVETQRRWRARVEELGRGGALFEGLVEAQWRRRARLGGRGVA